MTGYADLEIGLHHRGAAGCSVDLRFTHPGSESEVRLVPEESLLARFDLRQLRDLRYDDLTYGRALTRSLFAAPEVAKGFAQARVAAESQDLPLRVRLFIGPSAPELHALRWETLRDPDDDAWLATNENVLFSRYLSSLDWRPAGLRSKSDLRALVVIADPSDLDTFQSGGRGFPSLDVSGELERARRGLAETGLARMQVGERATLEHLISSLRDGHDILYLVCHGFLHDGEPQLLMEDDSGKVSRIAGRAFVEQLRELRKAPSLVILASCQSAGGGETTGSTDEGALAALGPRIAEVGIPAVVAMQGNISMRTVAEFMPAFFRELDRDGQIDRAMAVARAAVRERPDWWVPALFMRLKSGRIWYAPGFARDRPGFEKWPVLLSDIRRGKCTPVLGPGLTDAMLGSRQDIARRWADTFHFPMAPHDREDLPQVAQYLAVNLASYFPREQLGDHIRQQLLDRYASRLPGRLREGSVDEIMEAVWGLRRSADPREAHAVLAELPFRLYVTVHPANLMGAALSAAGRTPQIELYRWNSEIEWPPLISETRPDYRPSAAEPLVYYLFGRLDNPDSLVLTEDDYFDYLIGVATGNTISHVVQGALANSALLFLGFRMDEWDFRVLFRSIMRLEGGRGLRYRFAHVAAQIDPEQGQTLEPERARRYLESYFQDARISIYWGSVEDFAADLHDRWKRERP
ncbi:MAG: CHAT domain-containing protein [Actinomycetota bacterium]